METRLVSPSDASLLADLHSVSFEGGRWSEFQIASSLALQTTKGVIDTASKGFILCQITDEDAEILTLCVVPSARRKGIALALLQSAATLMTREGVKRIHLEVAATNTPAIALYRKFGFEIVGTRPRYYAQNTDAILMTKQ